MLNNHGKLMELWDWSLDKLKDPDMKLRITGVKSMLQFRFFFGSCFGVEKQAHAVVCTAASKLQM